MGTKLQSSFNPDTKLFPPDEVNVQLHQEKEDLKVGLPCTSKKMLCVYF